MVTAYIAVRLMCGRFQKNHALHTACYSMPWSALDHDQLTHSTPQSLTVSAAVWPPLPAVSLSLTVCVCMVSHSNGSQLHCSTWWPSTVTWWGGAAEIEACSLGLLVTSVHWHCWLCHLTHNYMDVLCGMSTIQYSARSACLSVRVL